MKLGCLYGLWPFLYTGGHWIFEDWVLLSTSLGFNITSFSSDTILIRSKVCVKILRVRRCVQSEIQLSTGVGGLTEEVHRRHRILTSMIILENKTTQAWSTWSFNTFDLRHLSNKTSFWPFPAKSNGSWFEKHFQNINSAYLGWDIFCVFLFSWEHKHDWHTLTVNKVKCKWVGVGNRGMECVSRPRWPPPPLVAPAPPPLVALVATPPPAH